MKKVGLLCLALVLALGSLGVGFARWYDDLYVDGYIKTGTVCWEWVGVTWLDICGTEGPDWHCYPGFVSGPNGTFWLGTKHVGCTSAHMVDSHHISLYLDNVYPCYFNEISLYAINCGTVPIHFELVRFTSDFGEVVINWKDNSYDPVSLDLTGDGNDDIEFKWGNHIGSQLHPGEETGEMSFWIHVMQPAPQGEELYFTISLEAVQYNESIHPIP
jgi:hypothetical protein